MTLHDVSVTCRSLACEIVRVTLAPPTLFVLPKLTFQPTCHLLDRVLLFWNHIGLHVPSHLTSTQNSLLSYCSNWMSRLYTRTAIVNRVKVHALYTNARDTLTARQKDLYLKLKIYCTNTILLQNDAWKGPDCEHKKHWNFFPENVIKTLRHFRSTFSIVTRWNKYPSLNLLCSAVWGF